MTDGYTLDADLIENIPLGTGSFTQLAILAPGANADFLGGAGTNAGLGNQNIFANGQRDTSNTFSFNSVDANNLFNGLSSSAIGESRFVLNTNDPRFELHLFGRVRLQEVAKLREIGILFAVAEPHMLSR
jgi:hypothetical protein